MVYKKYPVKAGKYTSRNLPLFTLILEYPLHQYTNRDEAANFEIIYA